VTRSVDGLADLGKDRLGKRWWRARLFWTCERTGKAMEARRKFSAPSKGAALVERDRLLEEARAGTQRTTRPRFRQVADEWCAAIPVYATRVNTESIVRKLNAHFGEWWFDVITVRHLQDFLDGLTIGADSVNNVRAALVGIYRHAVKRRIVDMNLAKLTDRRRPTVAASEDGEIEVDAERALTPAQLAAYLDDMETDEPELYPLIHTSFMLGCRFSEVSALRKVRVDLATGLVDVRRGQYRGVTGVTKGKRARTTALPPEGVAVLRAHLERMAVERWPGWEDIVFPRPPFKQRSKRDKGSVFWASATVHRKIRESFKRCGIVVAGKTHISRHTMASVAHDLSVDEALLMEVIGHRSKQIHRGYVHARDAQRIELGAKVGKELLSERKKNDE
jgi:integrase